MKPSGLHRVPRPRRAGFGPGMSLIELVAALAITTVLLSGIAMTLSVAAKALPSASDAMSAPVSGTRVVNQIAGELESALYVFEQTPTTLGFTVPARGTDTKPERIRYSWSGTPGDPLYRQYNGGSAAAVIPSVDAFTLNPTVATSTETYPGVATEDATDSLLIDNSGTGGLGDQNVSSSNWQGQYFGPGALPAGVVGWRPTRVQFQAKQSGLVATTNVQLALALNNFSPATPYSEQYTTLGSGLLSGYAWQQYGFTTIDRLAPNSGICLLLQWVLGTPNSAIVESNNLVGLLQTNNAGSSWSYVSNRALVSQMYGKLSHAGANQLATSRYLQALTITLRAGPHSNPAVTTTTQLFNAPLMASAYWEAKFDVDPTTLDVNGDGLSDWAPPLGSSYSASAVGGGTWQANGASLNTNPGDNFSRLTLVDVRFAATSSGSWAGVLLNAARNGTTCAPVLARITQQADGYQTLAVWRKLSDTATDSLLVVTNLPSGPTDLHLVIDPAYGSVGVRINGVEYGSFAYFSYTSLDLTNTVQLTSSGTAQFNYVRVQEALP